MLTCDCRWSISSSTLSRDLLSGVCLTCQPPRNLRAGLVLKLSLFAVWAGFYSVCSSVLEPTLLWELSPWLTGQSARVGHMACRPGEWDLLSWPNRQADTRALGSLVTDKWFISMGLCGSLTPISPTKNQSAFLISGTNINAVFEICSGYSVVSALLLTHSRRMDLISKSSFWLKSFLCWTFSHLSLTCGIQQLIHHILLETAVLHHAPALKLKHKYFIFSHRVNAAGWTANLHRQHAAGSLRSVCNLRTTPQPQLRPHLHCNLNSVQNISTSSLTAKRQPTCVFSG